MPYLEATIYEGMRIEPNVPLGVMHRVTKDTNFKGYFLEKVNTRLNSTILSFKLKRLRSIKYILQFLMLRRWERLSYTYFNSFNLYIMHTYTGYFDNVCFEVLHE